MTDSKNIDYQKALVSIEAKMAKGGCSRTAFKAFSNSFNKLSAGDTGMISESEISPVSEVPKLTELADFEEKGKEAAKEVVLINLNGGLGTSMGLNKAKSLLPVKNNLSFLEIIANQVLYLRKKWDSNIPLLLMNSFRTEKDSLAILKLIDGLETGQDDIPYSFVQNKVPKLRVSDLHPIDYPEREQMEWCPPGHGDIYCCLYDSGILELLLTKGYKYAFVSNADNLGAEFDSIIAGYMAQEQIPFLMEVARRTAADKKGGHLANSNNGLLLRERAQCPPDDISSFEDVNKYTYFNTNSLWINLEALKAALDKHDGFLDLPLIRNAKTVDPANAKSEQVYQLETAMGSAISVFDGASALHVPRTRFAPVKTTNDLLELWSENFEVTNEFSVRRREVRDPVEVQLDENFFRNLKDFKARFPFGAPDLAACEKLEITGDVKFEKNITLSGIVRIINNSGRQQIINADSELTGEITF